MTSFRLLAILVDLLVKLAPWVAGFYALLVLLGVVFAYAHFTGRHTKVAIWKILNIDVGPKPPENTD